MHTHTHTHRERLPQNLMHCFCFKLNTDRQRQIHDLLGEGEKKVFLWRMINFNSMRCFTSVGLYYAQTGNPLVFEQTLQQFYILYYCLFILCVFLHNLRYFLCYHVMVNKVVYILRFIFHYLLPKLLIKDETVFPRLINNHNTRILSLCLIKQIK